MPRYRFVCEDCGRITEVVRRMTDEKSPGRCRHCGSSKLRRVFSAVAMSVKGDAWEQAGSCCGRDEPCSSPPCSETGICRH